MFILTLSTAFLTASGLFAVTYACNGSSSPGSGWPSLRPTFPSFTEPFPRIIILAPVSLSIAEINKCKQYQENLPSTFPNAVSNLTVSYPFERLSTSQFSHTGPLADVCLHKLTHSPPYYICNWMLSGTQLSFFPFFLIPLSNICAGVFICCYTAYAHTVWAWYKLKKEWMGSARHDLSMKSWTTMCSLMTSDNQIQKVRYVEKVSGSSAGPRTLFLKQAQHSLTSSQEPAIWMYFRFKIRMVSAAHTTYSIK